MPPRKPPSSAAKPSAGTRKTASAKRGAARRPAAGKAATPADPATADPGSPEAQAARDEAMRANLSQLRELMAGGVMLTAQRVQEAMDDAVRRGKMTRHDAEEVARSLVDVGRRQSLDLVAEIEQLLGRGRSDLGSASSLVRDKTDRVLSELRRGAGVPPALGIDDYDDMTAAKIIERLDGLTPSQLRRVRDHEKRAANRKSVLAAVEKALA